MNAQSGFTKDIKWKFRVAFKRL